ncbi:MAG: DUF58 domain-containing protein [Victivallales bacterium]|nr:DUF58 domain-containing protein [Victivallales bacterium]
MQIKVKPTKAGLFLMFLLLLFYVFSIMSQTGLMYLFLGIVIGVILTDFIYGIFGARALTFYGLNKLITTEGKPFDTEIKVVNSSRKGVCCVTLKSDLGILCSVDYIKGKNIKHITPKAVFYAMGIYRLDKLSIETLNPFGLFTTYRKLRYQGIIKVYPELYPAASPPASGFEPMLGGHYKGYHSTLFGEDFSGIRPYTKGDPVKFIHWKASSRGQGLYVKEFREEFSGKITFFIQLKDNINERNKNVLNSAVRALGSLAFSALDLGHSIEIADFSFSNYFKASPFFGDTEILEYLTALKSDKHEPESKGKPVERPSFSRKASQAFILSKLDKLAVEEVKNKMTEQKKKSVYIPEMYKNDQLIKEVLNITPNCFFFGRSKLWKI